MVTVPVFNTAGLRSEKKTDFLQKWAHVRAKKREIQRRHQTGLYNLGHLLSVRRYS